MELEILLFVPEVMAEMEQLPIAAVAEEVPEVQVMGAMQLELLRELELQILVEMEELEELHQESEIMD
mgnify:CR=1 FL=1